MSVTTPVISLLIPVYNVERYLRQCLESARQQTFSDIEIVCINDGSTDGSRAIIQKFMDEDARFRVIDKENSGYGASMNQGLATARGTYVAILESDDFFEPNALDVLYHAAEEGDAEVAKANYWFYWSYPEERRELFEFVDPGLDGKTVRPADVPDVFYRKPSIWSAIYRRDFLNSNGIRFLETPGASYQDAAFNFKVWACASRAAFITEPVLSYRQDNESSSVNSPAKVFCVCDEYDEMERFLLDRPELRRELEGIKERMKFDTYMWNYDRLTPELQKDFLVRAAREFKDDLNRGDVDLSLFETWAEATLMALIKDPTSFEKARAWPAEGGKLNTFRHYYALGGIRLVAKLLKEKVSRRGGEA